MAVMVTTRSKVEMVTILFMEVKALIPSMVEMVMTILEEESPLMTLIYVMI